MQPIGPAIRDTGFGLPFNRGFTGKGPFFTDSGYGVQMQQAGIGRQGLQREREAKAQRAQDWANMNAQFAHQDRMGQQQADLQRQAQANQYALAAMGNEAAKYPHQLRQSRWNQVLPMVTGMLGGPGSGQSWEGYAGRGQVGQQPNIDASPVYNQQEIQEQVNATRAQNDAALASRQAANARSLAGRGFGSRSPLAMAMEQAAFGQNLAGNTAAEQQLRFGAAKTNAEQLLAAQQAQEQQFGRRQAEDIDRGKIRSGLAQSLLGSLLSSV